MEINSSHEPPRISQDAVLVKSVDIPPETQTVRGYSFDEGIDYHELLSSFTRSGFQATHFGRAVDEVKAMLKKRSEPMGEVSPHVDEELKPKTNCTIFLAYTSNMTSSGMREVIRFLVKNKMVDCLVTTGGGIEEDFIKCMAPTYIGDFKLKGSELRSKGLNRIGNLIAPNNNYCLFEDWLMPVLDQMLVEQQREDVNWTPSKMIHRLGKEINHQDSIYYWAYKNNIPVFSPAITDGAIGDNIYFHSYKNPGLRIDIAEDELIIEIWEPCGDEHQSLPSLDTDPMRVTGSLIPYFQIPGADFENLKNVSYIKKINNLAVYARNTGMIILGGGLIKHHTCNANLMRNGADYSVYINTAHEFDGSDAGASPDEAVSWGKIKTTATPVKVVGDATILFPLLVAETFARDFHSSKVKRTVDDSLEE